MTSGVFIFVLLIQCAVPSYSCNYQKKRANQTMISELPQPK
jgi:hypothetical protein